MSHMQPLAIALIVVGLVVTTTGALRIVSTGRGTRVEGTVLGTSSAGTWFSPLRGASFRYTDANGAEQSVWTPDGTGSGPAVSRPVQVVHDPASPQTARIVPPLMTNFVFFAIGDALLVAGILILVL